MSQKNIIINQELDIKGEVCPYTFVKSKLALEDMETGQILKVIVDNSESASNVPRSLANEDNEVLEVNQPAKSVWEIYVKKA